MVIRTASRDDLPALRDLFARANDAPYDLTVVAEEKCFGRGFGGEAVVRVIGNVDAAAVTCGKYLRLLVVDRDKRGRGLGSALLADSGAKRIAAEPGNYFTPGVVTTDVATIGFLERRGFRRGAITSNLHAALTRRPKRPPLHEKERALDFIEREFGPIWRFEASRAPALFVAEEEGEIAGFAVHEANNRGLGWFGPTGVAKQFRGRGIGRRLLLASLADLHAHGHERVIIPWTDAIDFYRKACGAEVAHQFVALDSAP